MARKTSKRGPKRNYRFKAKRWPKKRRFGSRRSGATATARIRAVGVPERMMVKMPWTTMGTLTAPSGNYVVDKDFRVNSAWDPDPAVATSSALFLTEFSQLYRKYRVYKVDYDVEITNIMSAATATYAFLHFHDGDSFSTVDPNTWGVRFTRQFQLQSASAGSNNTKHLRGSISIPKLFGRTPEQYRTDDSYTGDLQATVPSSGNPDFMAFMRIGFLCADQSTRPNIQYKVKLVLHTELFDRPVTMTSAVPGDE